VSVTSGVRFNADPDPIFHFDAHSDPDMDPFPRFTPVGNSDFCLCLIHSSASLYCFIFLGSIKDVTIFNIFDNILKFTEVPV
jgi:hypothetical protein